MTPAAPTPTAPAALLALLSRKATSGGIWDNTASPPRCVMAGTVDEARTEPSAKAMTPEMLVPPMSIPTTAELVMKPLTSGVGTKT